MAKCVEAQEISFRTAQMCLRFFWITGNLLKNAKMSLPHKDGGLNYYYYYFYSAGSMGLPRPLTCPILKPPSYLPQKKIQQMTWKYSSLAHKYVQVIGRWSVRRELPWIEEPGEVICLIIFCLGVPFYICPHKNKWVGLADLNRARHGKYFFFLGRHWQHQSA